jgi:hypothetical protein
MDKTQRTHFADDKTLEHIATLERDLAAAEKRVKRLEDAIRPFANFACEPDGDGPCGCFNCIARAALETK